MRGDSGSSIPLQRGVRYTFIAFVQTTSNDVSLQLVITGCTGQCEFWCNRHSKPWAAKCAWKACNACSSCGCAQPVVNHTFRSAHHDSWQPLVYNFTSHITTESATLAIVGSLSASVAQTGAARRHDYRLGAVSLLPTDGHVEGMRRDVVELMREIGFRGPLRWPGGCYSSVAADWREGLLPPHLRPPSRSPPPGLFCEAVPGGILPYTDEYVQNAPGVDEYMRLCERIGAEPALGVQMQFGSKSEIDRAVALIQYVNGDARSTEMGQLRASRGRVEPYRVRKVYVGNEAGTQNRFLDLHEALRLVADGGLLKATPPAPTLAQRRAEEDAQWQAVGVNLTVDERAYNVKAVGPTDAVEYARIYAAATAALLAADSTLQLILANGSPNVTHSPSLFHMSGVPAWADEHAKKSRLAFHYHRAPLQAAGDRTWAASYHYYAYTPPGWTPRTLSTTARQLPFEALEALRHFRRRLDDDWRGRDGLQRVGISLDEWGLGPPWREVEFGVGSALFAASLLTLLAIAAEELLLLATNYYEPINDGAIVVGPHGASLTPLGETFALYACHQGQRLLRRMELGQLFTSARHDDVAILATVDKNGVLLLSAANRNAAAPVDVPLTLIRRSPSRHGAGRGSSAPACKWVERVNGTLLEAAGIDPVAAGFVGAPGFFEKKRLGLVDLRALPPGTPERAGRNACTRTLTIPPFSIAQLRIEAWPEPPAAQEGGDSLAEGGAGRPIENGSVPAETVGGGASGCFLGLAALIGGLSLALARGRPLIAQVRKHLNA